MGSDVVFGLEEAQRFAKAEALWTELEGSRGGPFFTSATWMMTWLRLLPAGMTRHILIARRAGKPVAAAILVPRRTTRRGLFSVSELHFNSTGDPEYDCALIEHNGFAGHCDAPELWLGLSKWFCEGGMQAEELFIPGVEKPVTEMLASPNLLQTVRNVAAFRAPLRQLAEEGGFEASLSRNARQQLNRAKRDYRSSGELQLDEARTIESAIAYFDELKRLHIRSWTRRSKPHAFRYAFFDEFHRALIAIGVPQRAVQLLRISAGSRTLGYLYNFRYGNKIYAYQSGFEDSDPDFRPGYVSHAMAIESAMAEGAEEYDFLAGGNQLKRTFGRENYTMSWCTLRQAKLKFRAEAAVRYVAGRITDGMRR